MLLVPLEDGVADSNQSLDEGKQSLLSFNLWIKGLQNLGKGSNSQASASASDQFGVFLVCMKEAEGAVEV